MRRPTQPVVPFSAVQRAASVLSPERRQADCQRLADQTLDLLVIGGGVTGSGTALDAATRGLSVGLVEAQDWAAGTSSRSSKLVHGGLRYLQMLDFHLVREGLKERGLLIQQLAPHLVRPVPVLYPLRRRLLDRAYVGAGVTLYDLLGYSMGARRGLPWHRHLTRKQAFGAAPALRPGSLAGAIVYQDGQVDDARFVIELVRTACAYGATALNRVKVVEFIIENGHARGALVQDVETGKRFAARARVTVIATGAWAEQTEALAGHDRPVKVRPSKGVHLVLRRDRLELTTALVVPTERSVLFVLPWGQYWLVGTTDTDWAYDKAAPLATSKDVAYLLSELSSVLAGPVDASDVVSVFAGLRPLVAADGSTAKVSREHVVARPQPGLVAVSGGKYTTYRVMAQEVVDTAFLDPALSGDVRPSASVTETTPLLGARQYADCWDHKDELASRYELDEERVETLLHRYGSYFGQVLEPTRGRPWLARPLDGPADYLQAEVVYAVSHENARHLDDVMARRTRLAIFAEHGGTACADQVTKLMAPMLGWDEQKRRAELDDYQRQVDLLYHAANDAVDDEQASVWAGQTGSLLERP